LKADVKFWPDTQSLDLSIHAETDTETRTSAPAPGESAHVGSVPYAERAVRLTFDTGTAVTESGTH